MFYLDSSVGKIWTGWRFEVDARSDGTKRQRSIEGEIWTEGAKRPRIEGESCAAYSNCSNPYHIHAELTPFSKASISPHAEDCSLFCFRTPIAFTRVRAEHRNAKMNFELISYEKTNEYINKSCHSALPVQRWLKFDSKCSHFDYRLKPIPGLWSSSLTVATSCLDLVWTSQAI